MAVGVCFSNEIATSLRSSRWQTRYAWDQPFAAHGDWPEILLTPSRWPRTQRAV